MRIRILVIGAVAALALQACVGDKPLVDAAAQSNLQSLQLFNKDASPRFTFYLACSSDTVNCGNVENWFDQWADARHVTLRKVEANDASFAAGQPSRVKEQALPYRLAVHYEPWIKPSYTVTSMYKQGGSYPPLLGYSATVYVFDSATGRLLQSLPMRAEKAADSDKGSANPYLHAQVESFLASLGPA
jgi:hypothetical protein